MSAVARDSPDVVSLEAATASERDVAVMYAVTTCAGEVMVDAVIVDIEHPGSVESVNEAHSDRVLVSSVVEIAGKLLGIVFVSVVIIMFCETESRVAVDKAVARFEASEVVRELVCSNTVTKIPPKPVGGLIVTDTEGSPLGKNEVKEGEKPNDRLGPLGTNVLAWAFGSDEAQGARNEAREYVLEEGDDSASSVVIDGAASELNRVSVTKDIESLSATVDEGVASSVIAGDGDETELRSEIVAKAAGSFEVDIGMLVVVGTKELESVIVALDEDVLEIEVSTSDAAEFEEPGV